MFNVRNTLLTAGLCSVSLLFSTQVTAVGAGLNFNVEEKGVPGAFAHGFSANSLDFTYHSCVEIGGQNNDKMREKGYVWISSYQDIDSVVDSQLNHYLQNGYHMYVIYDYDAKQVGAAQNTPTGQRLNYVIRPANNASFTLYLDPESDTDITINDICEINVTNRSDDYRLGRATTIAQGEKSETNGLAMGDFKLVFSDWRFNTVALNPILPIAGYEYQYLVFNGNVTRLRGPLGKDHKPEGSGNMLWRQNFNPLPWTNLTQ